MGMRDPIALPSREELHRLFSYCPQSGELRWLGGPRAGRLAGSPRPKGYTQVNINHRLFYAHRIIWKMMTGEEPAQIDHKDTDSKNNKLDNLRPADNHGNNCNKKLTRANKSGFKGVHWHKGMGKWSAEVMRNYKKVRLGFFEDPAEAYAAYVSAASNIHGEFYNPGAAHD